MTQERVHKQRRRRDVEEIDETVEDEWRAAARKLAELVRGATTIVADIEREAS